MISLSFIAKVLWINDISLTVQSSNFFFMMKVVSLLGSCESCLLPYSENSENDISIDVR